MRRSGALFAVLLVLLVGIAIGAVAIHLMHVSRLHDSHRDVETLHLDHLSEMLELSPQQRREVEEILHQGRDEARRLHEEMLPRVRAHTEQVHARIRAVLDPDQQRRLEEVHARHRSSLEHLYLLPDSASTGD